ncbi:efflux RND transporter periplasmic adaptor subunit [Pedobacter sp. HMF7647]|uniref:Efflux RND transporter periplasmic adaptor subunit n=1 Tax=Hufsiella arboris TaxID=2695275 RepID=A0A7K1Y663_9SPHI|nr:efflux RND transporter periplasmic adaptor subunit [Hufsiella arboris]MXV49518.1 efflux RND transporter periplasmic adaptor subunit [Hufsiella arboris]
MNKFAIKNILSILSAAILLQACGSSESKDQEKTDTTQAPVTEVVAVSSGKLASSVKIPGELVAYQQVDLYAKVSSFIKKMKADIGSQVHTGQVLAVLEAPEYTAQLSGAESRLKSQEAIYLASKATYNRLLETSKTPGTVSANDLEVALAKQKSDQAQLDAARAAYREVSDTKNYLQIRAPFDGIITSRNVSAGAYVGPSGKGSEMPVFTLQEQSKLRLAVSVPELYSGELSNKTEVKFTVKSLPGQEFTAKVARLAGALDSKLRSQRIEMDVLNKDKTLLPGMVAEVNIPLQGSIPTFIVPSSAVLNSTTGIYVIRVSGSKAFWVPVKTGTTAEDKTEVYGDLKDGEQLVKTASEEIRDSSEVKNVKPAAGN